MHYQLTGPVRRYTDAQLLADLQATAARLQLNTITCQQYRLHGSIHPSIITRRFRTWNLALQQAGLTPARILFPTVAQLMENISHLWHILHRQPTMAHLRPPQSRFSRRPYIRTFGSWGNALRAFTHLHNTNVADSLYQQKTHDKKLVIARNEATSQYAGNQTLTSTHSNLSPAVASAKAGVTSATANIPHSTHIPWRVRYLTLKRDSFRCQACGASPATNPTTILHIDHIIPLSRGGTSHPSNLRTLCQQCNIGKSNL